MITLILIILVVAVITGSAVMLRRKQTSAPAPFAASTPAPDVAALVAGLRATKASVNDLRIRSLIDRACSGTTAFFTRVERTDPGNLEGFKREFGRHLGDLTRVVAAFSRAESDTANPDRQAILQQTKDAVDGYATYVEASSQRVGSADLIPFRVISAELAAKKYL